MKIESPTPSPEPGPAPDPPTPTRARRTPAKKAAPKPAARSAAEQEVAAGADADVPAPKPRARRTTAAKATTTTGTEAEHATATKPRARKASAATKATGTTADRTSDAAAAPKPRTRRATPKAAAEPKAASTTPKPRSRRTATPKTPADANGVPPTKPRTRTTTKKAAAPAARVATPNPAPPAGSPETERRTSTRDRREAPTVRRIPNVPSTRPAPAPRPAMARATEPVLDPRLLVPPAPGVEPAPFVDRRVALRDRRIAAPAPATTRAPDRRSALLVDDDLEDVDLDEGDLEEGDGVGARFLRAPLIAHAAALFALLLLLIPVVGVHGVFTEDEGAALLQAHHLADGHGWIVAPSFAVADPTGRFYPFENSDRGTKGYAAYAKHPLYPVILAASIGTIGDSGPLVVSIFGTVLAALLAAALARRLDRRLAVPTLWVVGVASPLLFDSFVVMAHTLAAAMAALAAWAAIRFVLARRNRCVVPLVSGAAVCMLLRTEGLILVTVMAATALGFSLIRRNPRAAVVGVVLFVTAGLTRAVEGRWVTAILGEVRQASASRAMPGGLGGRVDAFVTTWIRGGSAVASFLAIGALGALAVAADIARRRPDDTNGIRVFCSVAVVASLLFTLVAPVGMVSGLLTAFPLLAAGLILVRTDSLRSPVGLGLWISWWLFAAAVIVTQYSVGGGSEWGGRFFAIGLPLVVPVALDALRRAAPTVSPQSRRYAAGALAAVSLLMAVQGIRVLRTTHEHSTHFVRTLASRAEITPAGDGAAPVIISTRGLVPRTAWTRADNFRWLLIPGRVEDHLGPDLRRLHARLAELGIAQAVVVGHGALAQQQVRDAFTVTNIEHERGWWIDTVRVDGPRDANA